MINTDYIDISRYSDKSVVNKGRWQRYLLLGLATNIVVWGSAFLCLKVTPPTYTSSSALNLPGTWSNANVNLPDIGQANYENVSPYASLSTQDPREIYKFLAESEPVMKAAAAQLNMSLEEFGEPRIKVLVNTTIMTVDFKGASPEEARNKSLAFYKAFEARLKELRTQEANQKEISYEDALSTSQKKLVTVQKRLSDYKASSGLSSDAQISDLTTNIEQLRRQRAEIVAQQQQASTRFGELSTNLKLSAGQATDAFVIQTDQIFNLNWQDYVEFDERYLRPAEVELLIGDPSKARQQLGWEPSVTFEQLVALMVEADLQALGCTSSNGNGSHAIQDIATIRQELGSLHF
jgi:capsular polysaccharide biosynthesis protein